MDSNSIYDQHKMTALMFDKKQGRVKAASHVSITKDTDAHLMQHFHFDP